MRLEGKIAIVTGASRGIGAGIAYELAKQGAKVALTYTSASSESLVDELCSKISSLNNGSVAAKVKADLREAEAPGQIIAATLHAFPTTHRKIDILVNNAGVPMCKDLTDTSRQDISAVFDVNVYGTILMTKAMIPHLRAPGRIINIGSTAARLTTSGFSVYSASKAAIEGFTRSLAYELGSWGHTVNVIEPGAVETDMFREIPKDIVTYIKQSTPLGNRVGMPEDIAGVVAFLAEERSGWVTGQCISVSGGLTMN
ncbi:hypothetical protein N7474_001020 [Penicillium riverlandense]|uniref:uncharacterized protein n=1 Tax=Penicillium riverlandense TaxID=1903569 RepID=UPI00254838D1|nr:uncharacterized protein N7474_001020 [Penicillium riverlandense]KAJ5832709.1 hypothetical protein N7474_001020 [Penicillium riverlandense]